MVLLGNEGERWESGVVGVALLGTEVCFSHPRHKQMKDSTEYITSFSKTSVWYSLYDPKFVKEMNKVYDICTADSD